MVSAVFGTAVLTGKLQYGQISWSNKAVWALGQGHPKSNIPYSQVKWTVVKLPRGHAVLNPNVARCLTDFLHRQRRRVPQVSPRLQRVSVLHDFQSDTHHITQRLVLFDLVLLFEHQHILNAHYVLLCAPHSSRSSTLTYPAARRSYHGMPPGYAQLLESPTFFHIQPMQVEQSPTEETPAFNG